MSKVLFALTAHFEDEKGWQTGCYLLEVAIPYFYLQKKGVQIDFVSPKGGLVPIKQCDLDHQSVKDFFKDQQAKEKFEQSYSPAEIDASSYDAIYYPGGHGVVYDLPFNQEIAEIAKQIYEKGGYVCAVCHGGAALLNIQLSSGEYLVKGKNITAFSNSEEEALGTDKKVPFLLETALVEKGAIYSCAANWQSYVVVDERIITGQNPASDLQMAKELYKFIGDS
jgi:putative intracellular protease/amidase